jgi:hypothetical protein
MSIRSLSEALDMPLGRSDHSAAHATAPPAAPDPGEGEREGGHKSPQSSRDPQQIRHERVRGFRAGRDLVIGGSGDGDDTPVTNEQNSARSHPLKGMSRRSALCLAGAGGLAAAGVVRAVSGGGYLSGKTAASPAFVPPGQPKPVGIQPAPARWSQQFQPGHGWSAGGAGTASADPNDTSLHARGTQCFSVTTVGNGMQSFIRNEAMEAVDLNGRMIRLILRVDDTAHLHTIDFYLGARELGDYYYWRVQTHSANYGNYVGSGEWVTVHLQWADVVTAAGAYTISATGVPSVKSGFTDMSFAVHDDAQGRVRYHLQAVELIDDTTHAFPRGVVSITFDDSFRSVHDLARPVMSEHGFVGTVYNIAEAVGTDRYLTLPQMHSLHDDHGWEMSGHAHSLAAHNIGYDQLSSQEVDADLGLLRAWLGWNGFQDDNFAYPHGGFLTTKDGVSINRIAGEHFATARSILSEHTETLAPAMPDRLQALTGINDGNLPGYSLEDLTGVGARLDRCALDGSWLILALHQVTAGTPQASTEISQAGLASLMEAIAERGIPVATVGEVLAHG